MNWVLSTAGKAGEVTKVGLDVGSPVFRNGLNQQENSPHRSGYGWGYSIPAGIPRGNACAVDREAVGAVNGDFECTDPVHDAPCTQLEPSASMASVRNGSLA